MDFHRQFESTVLGVRIDRRLVAPRPSQAASAMKEAKAIAD